MELLRRFAVRRKGVGTILGAAYFIIIVLAIFNLIMWEVNQYDAYQQLVGQMNQIDQERVSENLEFVEAGMTDVKKIAGKYYCNLTVRNLGGITTNVVRIYFYNLSDTSPKALKIIEKGATGVDYLTNGFINPGEDKHKIGVVTSLDIVTMKGKSQSFYIYLATERGRTFSTFYPRAMLLPPGGSVPYIDIGPLRFVFDYNSLNYSTLSHPLGNTQAWRIDGYTSGTSIMFFVKVINIDTVYDIKLLKYCVFDCIEMAATGASQKISSFYIVSNASICPETSMYAYDENLYQKLPHVPDPENPNSMIPNIIKFGAAEWGTNKKMYLFTGGGGYPQYEYLVLMGFYYEFPIGVHTYGVTVPFVAIRVNTPT